MNKQLFQNQYAAQLKDFIASPFGQSFLSALGALRPPYDYPTQPHLLIEGRGAMRGYEMCLKNIILLSIPQNTVSEIEADYGVPNSPTQNK